MNIEMAIRIRDELRDIWFASVEKMEHAEAVCGQESIACQLAIKMALGAEYAYNLQREQTDQLINAAATRG